MNNQSNKSIVFLIAGAVDAIIGAVILLIYFGLLPIDISGLGIPRWVVGVIGGVWFIGAVGFLAYQLTKADVSE